MALTIPPALKAAFDQADATDGPLDELALFGHLNGLAVHSLQKVSF